MTSRLEAWKGWKYFFQLSDQSSRLMVVCEMARMGSESSCSQLRRMGVTCAMAAAASSGVSQRMKVLPVALSRSS